MANAGLAKTDSLLRHAWRVCLVLVTTFFLTAGAQAAATSNQRLAFDHVTTGYLLVGQHEFVTCEACHVGGVFKGTPKRCTGCHNDMIARGKTANHIPTSADCDSCHGVTASFALSAKMDHTTVTSSCDACHNGTVATGKPVVGHVATKLDCNSCHTTITFAGGRFAHTPEQVGTKTCVDCHYGTKAGGATGKGPTHIINSTNVCSACHQPNTRWRVKRVDHSQIYDVCSACHNGTISTGKGINHIPTTQECSYCHTVTDWGSTQFKRSPAKGVPTPNRNSAFLQRSAVRAGVRCCGY